MFFNFFLFSLIIYNAASDVVVNFFNYHIKALTSLDLKELNPMYGWPMWAILLIGFIVRDFVQWWTHRLLHSVQFLWEFHKVHHSVEEMGFAAHLRYHWMETIVYRTIEYLPLAILGIGLYDFFIIHIFTLAIGHFNHSNISVSGKTSGTIVGLFIGMVIASSSFDIHLVPPHSIPGMILTVLICMTFGRWALGPYMKIIFNSPEMHIWHHAKELPEGRLLGVNFGISLALWDYLFHTVYVPENGRDIKLGFPNMRQFPKSFIGQISYGFSNRGSK